MPSTTIRDTISALILLFAGGGIYLIYRQDIAGLQFIDNETLEMIKGDPSPLYRSFTGRWVLYTLPDMLWYASLLLLQTTSAPTGSRLSRLILTISVMLPFIWEGGQSLGIIAGTFDIIDCAGYLLTLIIIFSCKRKKLLELLCNVS